MPLRRPDVSVAILRLVRPASLPEIPPALPALLVSLALLAGAAFAGEAGQAGLLAARAEALRVHGGTSQETIEKLYRDAAADYAADPRPFLLANMVIYAELAGLAAEEDRALVEMVSGGAGGAEAVCFAVEEMRSHGTLAAHVEPVMKAAARLEGGGRLDVARVLASAFIWGEAPDEVVSYVAGEAREGLSRPDVVYLATALVSWGRADRAREALAGAATGGETSVDDATAYMKTMRDLGLQDEARKIVKRAVSKLALGPAAPETGVEDMMHEREAMLSPVVELARAADAWDVLFDKVKPRSKNPAGWQLADYAVVCGEAGLLAEKAEALCALALLRKDGEAQSLYGGALLEAGDAYGAQKTLLAAAARPGDVTDNAYLDLLDSTLALNDTTTLAAVAAAYATTDAPPQSQRMMSEIMRLAGDFSAADAFFGGFIQGSNLGADTRFNWEGSRLLAEYYLDTGRLEMGRMTATTALRQFVEVMGPRDNKTSPYPAKFVSLFARFGGVEQLLEYARSQAAKYPGSFIMAHLEIEALTELGRADETLAAVGRLYAGEKQPAMLELFLASSCDRLGLTGDAIRHYEAAIAADPKRLPGKAYIDLANLYAAAGRGDEAERLLTGRYSTSDAGTWASMAEMFESHGDAARARAAYMRLADVTMAAGPEAFGGLVRFLVERGEYGEAARTLARRVETQELWDGKDAYVSESMPRSAGAAPEYLIVGGELERGPLGQDRQVMALFYRELAARSRMLFDGKTALAALFRALSFDPANGQSLAQLVSLTEGSPTAPVYAAERLYETLSRASILAAVAQTDLAARRRERADEVIKRIVESPVGNTDMAALIAAVARHGAAPETLRRLAGAATQGWPWTFHASLAEAALAAGDTELAGREAALAAGGTFVGRALWAAGFYAKAGMPDKAAGALEGGADLRDHPSVRLMDARLSADARNYDQAREKLSAARRALGREPFVGMFDAEAARYPEAAKRE